MEMALYTGIKFCLQLAGKSEGLLICVHSHSPPQSWWLFQGSARSLSLCAFGLFLPLVLKVRGGGKEEFVYKGFESSKDCYLLF